jgi:MFS family permease
VLTQNRRFLIYAAGQAVSMLGSAFFPVAVLIAVIRATGSTSAGALVLAAEALPMVLFTLFGGVLGDRMARNVVMLVSDLLRAGTQFVMVVLLLHRGTPLWAFMATQFCYGMASAFFTPSAAGVVPQLVEKEEIPKANAILASLRNIGQIIGPAIAGVVVVAVGAAAAVAFDGATFLVSAATLAVLRLPAATSSFVSKPMFAMMRDGWAELVANRWLVVIVLYLASLVLTFNAPVMSLAPVVALHRLGGSMTWAMILSAFGAGSILGNVYVGRRSRPGRLSTACLSMLGTVPLLWMLGRGQWPLAVVGAAMLAGIVISAFSVTVRSRVHVTVRAEYLSRIGAYLWLANTALMPVGLSICSPLATLFGTSALFTISCCWVVAATFFAATSIWILERQTEMLVPVSAVI